LNNSINTYKIETNNNGDLLRYVGREDFDAYKFIDDVLERIFEL